MDGLDTFWYAILFNLLVVVAELEAQRLHVAVIHAFRCFCVVGGITTLGARQVLLKRCARRGHSGLFAAFRALARDAFCASLAIRGGAIFIHDFGMA